MRQPAPIDAQLTVFQLWFTKALHVVPFVEGNQSRISASRLPNPKTANPAALRSVIFKYGTFTPLWWRRQGSALSARLNCRNMDTGKTVAVGNGQAAVQMLLIGLKVRRAAVDMA